MIETWKDIPGYNGDYQVSNYGRVRSWKKEGNHNSLAEKPKILAKTYPANDYNYVRLWKNGSAETKSIHRLVAEQFVPNPDNKDCVNHIDSDPSNCKATNLEWCTHKENMQHASEAGRLERDKNHGSCKLSREDVLDIRNAYALGCFSQTDIADAYGIDQSAVSYIVNRKQWRYL